MGKACCQYVCLLLVTSAASGCGQDQAPKPNATPVPLDAATVTATYEVRGIAQKGPLQVGATVTIQEETDSLEPAGKVYVTTTTDDLGTFSLGTPIGTQFFEVIAQGRFFNEVANAIEFGCPDPGCQPELVTLHALARGESPEGGIQAVSVNLLTHLQSARLATLVQAGQSFDSAEAQARGEVLTALGLPPIAQSFDALTVADSGDANGELLAASVLVQLAPSTGNIAEPPGVPDMVDSLRQDLASGAVTSPDLLAKLASARQALDRLCPAQDRVGDALRRYYSERGVTIAVPAWRGFFGTETDGGSGLPCTDL
jgi:hypothetical protein